VVTGLGTWAIGEVAALYFETGKRLTPAQLRARYRQMRRLRRPHPTPAASPPAAGGGGGARKPERTDQ